MVHNELTVVARLWRTDGSWWRMRADGRKPVMKTISQNNSSLLNTILDILVAQLYEINGLSHNYNIIRLKNY